MTWEVEYTDQFGEWWDNLVAEEQEAVTAAVNVLQRGGPEPRAAARGHDQAVETQEHEGTDPSRK
jgi:hypothetical protein